MNLPRELLRLILSYLPFSDVLKLYHDCHRKSLHKHSYLVSLLEQEILTHPYRIVYYDYQKSRNDQISYNMLQHYYGTYGVNHDRELQNYNFNYSDPYCCPLDLDSIDLSRIIYYDHWDELIIYLTADNELYITNESMAPRLLYSNVVCASYEDKRMIIVAKNEIIIFNVSELVEIERYPNTLPNTCISVALVYAGWTRGIALLDDQGKLCICSLPHMIVQHTVTNVKAIAMYDGHLAYFPKDGQVRIFIMGGALCEEAHMISFLGRYVTIESRLDSVRIRNLDQAIAYTLEKDNIYLEFYDE